MKLINFTKIPMFLNSLTWNCIFLGIQNIIFINLRSQKYLYTDLKTKIFVWPRFFKLSLKDKGKVEQRFSYKIVQLER